MLMLSAGNASADVIGLKTNRAAGTQLTLALNSGVSATLEWSNGTTMTHTFTGEPVEISVVSDSLTVSTTEGSITHFYAPDAGLVSLNTSGAPALQRLMCADNSLSRLDLTANRNLVDLDCSDNGLSELTLTYNVALTDLNCAGNALDRLTIPSAAARKLEMLVCADNKLTSIAGISAMPALKSVWAQRNELPSLKFSSRATGLQTLLASSNGLTELALPAGTPYFTELWVENNKLAQLELDATAVENSLSVISADNNELELISWGEAKKAPALKKLYVENNSLFFNSLPKLRNVAFDYVVSPQNPYFVTETFLLDEKYELRPQLGVDCFGNILSGMTYTVTNLDGNVLERGSGKDYTYTSGNWTFLTPQRGVVITAQGNFYPDLVLTTVPARVVSTVGIGDVSVAGTDRPAEVYDLSGRRVSRPARGIYIVGGKKVLVK